MNGVSPNEYSLRMDTGEVLLVSELDPETSPGLTDPAVLATIRDVLEWCSFVSRESIEEAKRGYTRALQSELRSTPIGSLLRLRTPSCRLLRSCASAIPEHCTTRRTVRGKPSFPHCWEATVDTDEPSLAGVSRDVATYIVHSWREGRRVLIVRSGPGNPSVSTTPSR